MLATVVTYLEMTAPPESRSKPPASPAPLVGSAAAPLAAPPQDLTVEPWPTPAVAAYRALFRQIGADWLWVSRLVMAEDALAAILYDPAVAVYRLRRGAAIGGLLELDFRQPGQCELAFFGLTPAFIGTGAGRFLMDRAMDLAWRPGIAHVWVHTCTLDSPQALGFYRRSGFVPYKQAVELLPDPRLTGTLPHDAAPHVPLITG